MRNTENPLKWGAVIQFPRTRAERLECRSARLRKQRYSAIREEIERFEAAIRRGLIPSPTKLPYGGGAA